MTSEKKGDRQDAKDAKVGREDRGRASATDGGTDEHRLKIILFLNR
jgi:hypothetical protein